MLLFTILALVNSAAAGTIKALAEPKASYLGCFASIPGSFSPPAGISSSNFIIENCMAACNGYRYFSVKKGTDCRCSQSPPSGSTAPNMCTLSCTGNRFEICGGSAYSNFYALVGGPSAIAKIPSPAATNRIKRADAEIALNKRELVPRAGGVAVVSTGCFSLTSLDSYFSVISTLELQDLRVEDCMAYCTGSTYFGVAYGTTCFCYVAGSHSTALAAPLQVTSCLISCTGNQFELCGGSEAVFLYAYPKSIASSCVAATTSSTTSAKPMTQTKSNSSTSLSRTTTTTTSATSTTFVTVATTCAALPITNSGFETGTFSYWDYYNPISGAGGSWSIAPGRDSTRGAYVAQVSLLNPNTAVYGGFSGYIMQRINTCVGKTYTLSYQYQCTRLGSATSTQSVVQGLVSTMLACSSENTWYTGSFTWTANVVASDLYIIAIQNGVTQSIVQIDNIVVSMNQYARH